MFESGQILSGKYRVIERIGHGGMGEVWRGESVALRAPVAIKVIRPDVRDPMATGRFLREARAAAALRSTHVVQILDYGVEVELPYLVMELLRGESLRGRLSHAAPLDLTTTAEIFVQVARAVGMAHDMGFVHRDLKPDNIFLAREGEDEVVKVLDFGLAKAVDQSLGRTPEVETAKGALLGTPYYMSPEQAEARATVDGRTDIWALAVIGFQCLTGELPFHGRTYIELLMQICTAEPRRPTQVVRELPPEIDAWFLRGVARSVDERYPTVRVQCEELVAIAERRGVVRRRATVARAERANELGPTPAESALGDALLVTDGNRVTTTHVPLPAQGARWVRPTSYLLVGLAAVGLGFWAMRSAPDPTPAERSVEPQHEANAAADPAVTLPEPEPAPDPVEPVAAPPPDPDPDPAPAPERSRSRPSRISKAARAARKGAAADRATPPKRPTTDTSTRGPDLLFGDYGSTPSDVPVFE